MARFVYRAQPSQVSFGWGSPARAAALGCVLSMALALPGHSRMLGAPVPVSALRASSAKRPSAPRLQSQVASGSGREAVR